MVCKNGHDTINEIGNCYTCGERGEDLPDEAASVPSSVSSPIVSSPIVLSRKLIERLAKEADYFKLACEAALKSLDDKKED